MTRPYPHELKPHPFYNARPLMPRRRRAADRAEDLLALILVGALAALAFAGLVLVMAGA